MIHAPDTIEKTAPYAIIGTIGETVKTAPPKVESKPQVVVQSSKVTNDFTKPNNTISLDPIAPTVPSTTENKNSGGTMGVLDKERSTATFDVSKLIDFMNGGKEMTKKFEQFFTKKTKERDSFWDLLQK
jgi:hypothetical protein